MRGSLSCFAVLLFLANVIRADDLPSVTLEAPKEWRTERIELPPGFAPDMSVSGFEEVRFAPGMFDEGSESFFSYVIVFVLADEPQDEDALDRELLAYYRGLAAAVAPGRGFMIDTDAFTLELTEPETDDDDTATDAGDDSTDEEDGTKWIGTLNWVEPFVTGEAQELRIEIRVGTIEGSEASHVTMCVSPQDADAEIWEAMHEVRDLVQFTASE